ncbi:MAG: hypothetical protein R3E01_28135 [Pirellulaceae bacterium]
MYQKRVLCTQYLPPTTVPKDWRQMAIVGLFFCIVLFSGISYLTLRLLPVEDQPLQPVTPQTPPSQWGVGSGW